MVRVSTLRVVFGHPRLTEALLRCFFDKDRQTENRVKRLWLDNVDIVAGTEQSSTFDKYGLPLKLDFGGVETLRLRRLPLGAVELDDQLKLTRRTQVVYSRGGRAGELSDGLGGNYLTTTNFAGAETIPGLEQAELADQDSSASEWLSPLEILLRSAHQFDDAIYAAIFKEYEVPPEMLAADIPSHYQRSLHTYMDRWTAPVDLNPEETHAFRQLFRTNMPSPAACAGLLLTDMSKTLTSLNIDWAVTVSSFHFQLKSADYLKWVKWYSDLFSMRFPHLRAFQYRNAVTDHTYLPPGLYLLDHSSSVFTGIHSERRMEEEGLRLDFDIDLKPLEFMEAHADQLKCLAWPVAHFFSHECKSDISPRVRSVAEKLGRSLVDLRVDEWYFRYPETQSEEDVVLSPNAKRGEFFFSTGPICIDADFLTTAHLSRRRFVSEFAAEMRVLKSIKVEGGIPRDERREIIAALRLCPIEKLVFIGIGSIIGNTWGARGANYGDEMMLEHTSGLEEEDEAAIFRLGPQPPSQTTSENTSTSTSTLNPTFTPSYGWRGREPMLRTIVSHHGPSLRELKMCGYKGTIALFNPSPIVEPMLAPLRHCHALESLMLSFWLPTLFEDDLRDEEIIAYWLNTRDAASTALVSMAPKPPLQGSWAYELETKFRPDVLAGTVASFLAGYLSSGAKRRAGGVHVRASFSMLEAAIFDLDVWVGEGEGGVEVIGWEGPSDETEGRRRGEKLRRRRWF